MSKESAIYIKVPLELKIRLDVYAGRQQKPISKIIIEILDKQIPKDNNNKKR